MCINKRNYKSSFYEFITFFSIFLFLLSMLCVLIYCSITYYTIYYSPLLLVNFIIINEYPIITPICKNDHNNEHCYEEKWEWYYTINYELNNIYIENINKTENYNYLTYILDSCCTEDYDYNSTHPDNYLIFVNICIEYYNGLQFIDEKNKLNCDYDFIYNTYNQTYYEENNIYEYKIRKESYIVAFVILPIFIIIISVFFISLTFYEVSNFFNDIYSFFNNILYYTFLYTKVKVGYENII